MPRCGRGLAGREIPEVIERQELFSRIAAELDRAYAKHGTHQWGRHEFYGIIMEEVEEMFDDIKADAPEAQLEKEIIQVAAMAIRFLETGDKYRAKYE